MTIDKKIKISKKVFLEKDIEQITKYYMVLYKEASRGLQKGYEFQVDMQLQIEAEDGTKYTEKNKDVNEDFLKGIISTKKSVAFDFLFRDSRKSNKVNIYIKEAPHSYGNIVIETDDENWFNATRGKLESILSDVKTQENFFLSHYKALFRLSSIYFGVIAVYLIFKIVDVLVEPSNNQKDLSNQVMFFLYILLVLSTYMIGASITSPLFNRLKELWPSIEFNFGPSHLKHSQNKRKKLSFIFTAFIAPILVGIFQGLFT
ncbi:MAG TPA: hypothetical protein VD947_03650 [Patescibacteria group bacterium]|nr:hypothetical protein [Patescibacteria group bacterium]